MWDEWRFKIIFWNKWIIFYKGRNIRDIVESWVFDIEEWFEINIVNEIKNREMIKYLERS